MELEGLAAPHINFAAPYPFQINNDGAAVLSFSPMWSTLLNDIELGQSKGHIAARFHLTVIRAVVQTVEHICNHHHIDVAALSGGVFQNKILLDHIGNELENVGVRVLRHRRIPANDGGISLGQATIASALMT